MTQKGANMRKSFLFLVIVVFVVTNTPIISHAEAPLWDMENEFVIFDGYDPDGTPGYSLDRDTHNITDIGCPDAPLFTGWSPIEMSTDKTKVVYHVAGTGAVILELSTCDYETVSNCLHPDWMPDNDEITCKRGGAIVAVNYTTEDETVLLENAENDTYDDPAVSPNGRWLAVISNYDRTESRH